MLLKKIQQNIAESIRHGMGPTHEFWMYGAGITPGFKAWALERRTPTRMLGQMTNARDTDQKNNLL